MSPDDRVSLNILLKSSKLKFTKGDFFFPVFKESKSQPAEKTT